MFGTKLVREFQSDPNSKTHLTKFDDSRMRNVLGIVPIDFKNTILDMVNSLIEFGLLIKP